MVTESVFFWSVFDRCGWCRGWWGGRCSLGNSGTGFKSKDWIRDRIQRSECHDVYSPENYCNMSPEQWWLEDYPFLLKRPPFLGDILVSGGVIHLSLSSSRSRLIESIVTWSFTKNLRISEEVFQMKKPPFLHDFLRHFWCFQADTPAAGFFQNSICGGCHGHLSVARHRWESDWR